MLCQRLSSNFGEDTQWPLIEAEGSENLDTSAATQSETFADKYVTLNQIGNGAFGSVYTAYKTSDKLLVVTKFIQKSKICQGCHERWVECGKHGERIPLEVSLLLTLKHPGIVNVIDVFQNESFVQMVMEKHGDMDLYEFIERKPKMNEALASLIFRQVVSAVGYLHSRGILHRDIKDENIVIDHNFQCRLIDFGSATFFKPGQLFSRFYGTLEYCSPEVLRGHPYRGPELEVWSLGVLLYTLMYGVNPFSSPEDTMLAKIYFSPFKDVSAVFKDLIEACLEADPSRRASLWYIRGHRFLNIPASFDDFRFSDVIPCKQSELDPPTHYQVI